MLHALIQIAAGMFALGFLVLFALAVRRPQAPRARRTLMEAKACLALAGLLLGTGGLLRGAALGDLVWGFALLVLATGLDLPRRREDG